MTDTTPESDPRLDRIEKIIALSVGPSDGPDPTSQPEAAAEFTAALDELIVDVNLEAWDKVMTDLMSENPEWTKDEANTNFINLLRNEGIIPA